jgi:hypothetical protein
MTTPLRTFWRWLQEARLGPPKRSASGDFGGVADRELDGLELGMSMNPPSVPGPADGHDVDHPASVPSRTSSVRPHGFPADYRSWKELALLLFSGRAPEGLAIGASLSLATLRIRSLPARLRVAGDLDLRQCQRLKRIGDSLEVGGDLLIGGRCPEPPWWETFRIEDDSIEAVPASMLRDLSRDAQCPLLEMPSGLRVGRDLRLRQCRRLERLPDDMRVGGSVRLEGCTALASLPEPWIVHGDLTISSAPRLTSLPARLRVEGSLRLVGVRVERLPGDLRVGGDLTLDCCPRLASLPEGLKVGGSLLIRRCPIDRLPPGLRIGRDLKLHRLRDLARLPEGLSVPGRLEVIRRPSLRGIAPGVRVGTGLVLRRCGGVRTLPDGLQVPGTLDLRGCTQLEALPGGMNVGFALGKTAFTPALRLADCRSLTSLPEDLRVGGPIEVAGSGLRDVPPRLARSARLLWRGVIVPPEVVFRPETLTPEQILGQPNAELRRVMLERAGLDRVLREAEAEAVDSDRDPGGLRRLVRMVLEDRLGRRRQRVYLHCRCPSTGRDYLLRVPPETRTCREAAAWLAGFDDPDAYQPLMET